ISCTALTGSLTVTTATTGSSQPTSYTVTVDGGSSRTLPANGGSTTYSGLSATDHTDPPTDLPANSAVSGGAPKTRRGTADETAGTSRTVTVPAGGSATASFAVDCPTPPPPTGSLTVTTATSGPNPPSGYTVTVDGGQSRSLGLNASTTYTGLSAASHTVQLNGVPANCNVSEGNPQTVTVAAGSTAQASFTITCTALTGSLTVATSTAGGTPDPDGYTVTVSGGGSQTIGNNDSVTFPDLATGSHTVTLSGIASNCSVSGGTSRTVTVTAGQTATASFAVD